MENIIILEAMELLRNTKIIDSESEFSEYWLGHSECYLRTLRFKNAEPSMGAIAICASRLQKAGERMMATSKYREVGLRFIALSEKCHGLVNADSVELILVD